MTTAKRTQVARRTFGSIRKLPSGRYQASHLHNGIRYTAPSTFTTKAAASAYLATVDADIQRGVWAPPTAVQAVAPACDTLAAYAARWMVQRKLAPRTRELYQGFLDRNILPVLGGVEMTELSPTMVDDWHAGLKLGPTTKAHSYALLATIMKHAVTKRLIPFSPCSIEGAGHAATVKRARPLTADQVRALAAAIEPRFEMLVRLAAGTSLRFGELAGLHRDDLEAGVVHVRRGVVRVGGKLIETAPKTEKSERSVTIPPDLIPGLARHLLQYAGPVYVFPGVNGGPLSNSVAHKAIKLAGAAIGRPEISMHTLRHTGQTLAAAQGASVPDLMRRAGHTTPTMAMHYAASADAAQHLLAAKLVGLAG